MLRDIKIKIHGHLDKHWEYMFNDMTISYEGNNTIFIGTIKDDAYLHGILNLIRDLNLKLISVNPLNEQEN